MWTAVAREIHSRTGSRCLPFEDKGNGFIKPVHSESFRFNPHIYNGRGDDAVFMLQLNNPATNYCQADFPDRAVHRYDKHVVEQICEVYGIADPKLDPELYFSESERSITQEMFLNQLPDKFVTIEPHSKMNYTPNRAYPFEKWQSVVDDLKDLIPVVQVGVKGLPVLENVIDMMGKMSFRQAAIVIEASEALISSEGGLTHVATAVKTPAVVIITGYQSAVMIAYPQNLNIKIASHGPCGLKKLCPECERETWLHDYKEIVAAVRSIIE